MTFPCIKCKIHKYTITQIRKYTNTKCGKVTIHGLGSLGSGLWAPGLWAPWALGSGQDVLGSRVYWAPEITGLPGLPNRNLLSVFEAVKDLLNRKQI